MSTRFSGERCQGCDRKIKKRPRYGKLRYPHKCPHGRPCEVGQRCYGEHANRNLCLDCAVERRTYELIQTGMLPEQAAAVMKEWREKRAAQEKR